VRAQQILIYTRRIGPALAYIAVLLIVLSPWILYSHQQFGVFFATDNGWVATAVDKTAYATDWRPDGVMTLADDPIGWLRKVIGNALWLVVLMGDDLLPPVLALAVAVSLLGRSRVGGLKAVAREGLRDDSVRRTALFALAMAGPLAGYVATGYLIGCYYGPWYWLVLVMAIGVGATLARSAAQRDVLGRPCCRSRLYSSCSGAWCRAPHPPTACRSRATWRSTGFTRACQTARSRPCCSWATTLLRRVSAPSTASAAC